MSRRKLGSIRKRGEGIYRVELSHGFDPLTGERRRMSETVHGTDTDAERALARMLLDIGQMPAGKAMTVRDFINDLYKPWLPGRVRKETAAGYESKLDNHVLPKLGDIQLTELQPYVLDRWRDDLLTKMSGQSAKHVYRVLSTALNRAVKWRLIATNPMLAVDPPKAEMRDLDTLDKSEAVDYLGAFRGHILEPMVALAIATGLRPCELYALTWADIDLTGSTLVVRRGLHERSGEVWFEQPKSERSNREVSLPAWVVEQLKPLRGLGPLVVEDGTHMRPTAVARAYRKHIAAKKLRYVPMRDLRHTHATLMLEAGVDVVAVSRRLGHSTVAITDKHYLRPKRSVDQAAADAFSELLATVGDKSGLASAGDKSTDASI